jgi:hypothetical protein
MVGLSRGVRQEVMNSLNFLNTGRWDVPLCEFSKPAPFNTGPDSDLPPAELRLIDQFVCTLQQVHCPSLAKFSPIFKENVPQASCDNAVACPNTHQIMSRRGWQLSLAPPAC